MNIPMQTFLLRGFFEDIPRELEEAAIIDGASKPRIFFSVMLPLTRPGLAVVAIFTFLYAWDEFPWANVAVNKDELRTLPIALAFYQSQHLTEWGMVFAGAIFAVVPVVLIFVIFQRYFVSGISTTGMKG
jgi:multiple sugar transport system permease protein